MNYPERLTQIIDSQDQTTLLSFLQELPRDQRRPLVPAVKRLVKAYLNYQLNNFGVWRQEANRNQQKMLILASLATMNRTEFTRVDADGWLISSQVIDILLQGNCPDWFSDYVNALASRAIPQWLYYLRVVELETKGLINPSPELIARLLPQLVLDYQRNKQVFRSSNLFIHPQTLNEHFWYLFQYESDIHWNERFAWHDASGVEDDQNWTKLLVSLSEQGTIDRLRLLRETALATSRFQNKNLVGWFINLLVQLAPTTQELLALQEALSATFYTTHRKPINCVLKYFKQLVTQDGFDGDRFLEHASVLLTSETKSVVAATLMILDKLARRHPDQAGPVSRLTCQALVHTDSAVQLRAAKLIAKHGSGEDEELSLTIACYGDSLYQSAHSLLSAWLTVPPALSLELNNAEAVSQPIISEGSRIAEVDTMDDLMFLASQAFDNNSPLHFDLLPAALIRLNSQMNGENIAKLLPAFQRAYQLLMMDWRSTQGLLDHMLANFLVDYGQYLVKRFPTMTAELQNLHEGFVRQDREETARWAWQTYRIEPLNLWRTHHHDPMYRPFRQLLLEVLEALQREQPLPLLSTPTHTPYWIDPVVLVERLRQYQQQNVYSGFY